MYLPQSLFLSKYSYFRAYFAFVYKMDPNFQSKKAFALFAMISTK